jgi:divalent metal cation (Fe/Co/Zn/Cd) transporter
VAPLLRTQAVAASLADSAVDVLSQGVLSVSQYYISRPHREYPVGRARLEALGVIACSCIMSVASLEVLQYAVTGKGS